MNRDNIIELNNKKIQIIFTILKFCNLSFIYPHIGPNTIIDKLKNKGAYCINVPLNDIKAPYTLKVLKPNPIPN